MKLNKNINESYASNKSRKEIEEELYEILDRCSMASCEELFYEETGFKDESFSKYSTEDLMYALDNLNEKGLTDEDFYIDYENGIDWEPEKYMIREKINTRKTCTKLKESNTDNILEDNNAWYVFYGSDLVKALNNLYRAETEDESLKASSMLRKALKHTYENIDELWDY